MENGPFIDDFPSKSSIYRGSSMAIFESPEGLGFLDSEKKAMENAIYGPSLADSPFSPDQQAPHPGGKARHGRLPLEPSKQSRFFWS